MFREKRTVRGSSARRNALAPGRTVVSRSHSPRTSMTAMSWREAAVVIFQSRKARTARRTGARPPLFLPPRAQHTNTERVPENTPGGNSGLAKGVRSPRKLEVTLGKARAALRGTCAAVAEDDIARSLHASRRAADSLCPTRLLRSAPALCSPRFVRSPRDRSRSPMPGKATPRRRVGRPLAPANPSLRPSK
jgi:hypothetical protein